MVSEMSQYLNVGFSPLPFMALYPKMIAMGVQQRGEGDLHPRGESESGSDRPHQVQDWKRLAAYDDIKREG